MPECLSMCVRVCLSVYVCGGSLFDARRQMSAHSDAGTPIHLAPNQSNNTYL